MKFLIKAIWVTFYFTFVSHRDWKQLKKTPGKSKLCNDWNEKDKNLFKKSPISNIVRVKLLLG